MDIVGNFALVVGCAALLWFWWDTLRSRERAMSLARHACERAGVQLLDETVSVKKLSFARGRSGNLQFQRYYEFSFSMTGGDRRGGTVVLIGLLQKYLVLDLPQSATISVVPEVINAPRLPELPGPTAE